MSNSSIILEFNNKDEDLAGSLSAALFAQGHLWVASDEATSVERLSTSDDLTFDGSGANKISTTIYSGLNDYFSTISCIVREFLHQNHFLFVHREDKPAKKKGSAK